MVEFVAFQVATEQFVDCEVFESSSQRTRCMNVPTIIAKSVVAISKLRIENCRHRRLGMVWHVDSIAASSDSRLCTDPSSNSSLGQGR